MTIFPENSFPENTAGVEIARHKVVRILDANLNRATEGLRVIEEYARFVLDDTFLCQSCKELRHDLVAATAEIGVPLRLASRETQHDVGTGILLASEQHRPTADEVLAAAFPRLQQSLRSLEEYGKTISPPMAARIEQLRYRSYTLHRAFAVGPASRERLADIRLYLLIDGRSSAAEFHQFAEHVIAAGVDAVQLRDKSLDDRRLIARGRCLRELTRERGVLLIINDRPDLALICDADGVHVGQEEMSVKDVRMLVGARRLIGVSTHSIDQARQAVLDGADYIGCGPTFPSRTKTFANFPGLGFLRQVTGEIRLPTFAIGGIGLANVADVLATGVARIAVGDAVLAADDPAEVVRRLKRAVDGVE